MSAPHRVALEVPVVGPIAARYMPTHQQRLDRLVLLAGGVSVDLVSLVVEGKEQLLGTEAERYEAGVPLEVLTRSMPRLETPMSEPGHPIALTFMNRSDKPVRVELELQFAADLN